MPHPTRTPRRLSMRSIERVETQMSERLTLPVLPLREVVLFPGVTTPIGAGRPGTVRAVEAALNHPDKLIFALCQRDNTEQVSSEGLYTIGTIARIGQLH